MLAAWPAGGAVVKSDVEYGRAGDVSLRLDVCIPDGKGPFPAAILIHGGAWSGGDKRRDVSPLFGPLTRAGFVWFSINYRLAPKHPWPACFDDVQTAVQWVALHAPEYKADPARLALIGYSAGGHLACLAALMAGDDSPVRAVVGLAADTDFESDPRMRNGLKKPLRNLLGRANMSETDIRTVLRGLSPIDHVRTGAPPFLLLHGSADRIVPVNESIHFQSRLDACGVPVELVILKGAPHSLAGWFRYDPGYPGEIIAWLRHTLGP
jgi:alpha-L-fucosidase 2